MRDRGRKRPLAEGPEKRDLRLGARISKAQAMITAGAAPAEGVSGRPGAPGAFADRGAVPTRGTRVSTPLGGANPVIYPAAMSDGWLQAHHRAALIAILVLALVVRLGALVAESGYEPVYDSIDYDRHARSIAAGDGFPESHVADGPSAFRPPLYPYVLGAVYAITGDDAGVEAGRALGVLVGAIVVLGIYAVGRLAWSREVGLIAAAIAAVFPPLAFSHLALISETIFVALELGVVVCALAARRAGGDWRWALAAGLLCGLAALTRSNGILLVIPALIGVWVGRPLLSPAALAAPAAVAGATLLALAPWTIRNANEFDALIPTNTQSGYGLAGAFNDEARSVNGYTATWVLPERTERYRQILGRPGLDEHELDSELRSSALEFVRENPGFVAEGAVLNFARTFSALGQEPATTIADREQLGLGERTAPIVKWSVRVLDVLALLAVIVIAVRDPSRFRPWFVWLVPALAVLAAVWVLGSTRYAIPAYPFMILLVALAARALRPAERGRTG